MDGQHHTIVSWVVLLGSGSGAESCEHDLLITQQGSVRIWVIWL